MKANEVAGVCQVGRVHSQETSSLGQGILCRDQGKVVYQDGGMKFLANSQGGFPAELLDLEATLDMAEGFFDAPAAMVKLGEGLGGE